jgi:HNH endonuclease
MGCILWERATNKAGYGICGRGLAHRAAFETAFGPIPAGMCVLHRCDVRSCVNPEHLFLGTQADNVKDMDAKGRRVSMVGSKHALAKFAEADVAIIKWCLDAGVRGSKLARLYEVSDQVISFIKTGLTWKHVEPLKGCP